MLLPYAAPVFNSAGEHVISRGHYVRGYRKARGLTQGELAQWLNVSRASINAWEGGRTSVGDATLNALVVMAPTIEARTPLRPRAFRKLFKNNGRGMDGSISYVPAPGHPTGKPHATVADLFARHGHAVLYDYPDHKLGLRPVAVIPKPRKPVDYPPV